MKKLICCCLIMAALLGLSVAAAAVGNETVTVTANGEADPGELVIFTVTVSGADSVRSCEVVLDYPTNAFEEVSFCWEVTPDTQVSEKIGEWNADKDINGKLAQFVLKVKQGVKAGDKYEVGCVISVTDEDTDLPHVYSNVTKAKVTISCNHPSYGKVESPEYIKQSGGCTDPTVYFVSCTVCGAAGQETFTAAAGVHDFSAKVEAEEYLSDAGDCQNKRQYFYSCAVCGEKGEQTFVSEKKFGVHVYDNACDSECNICGKYQEPAHETSGGWKSDDTGHWLECSVCLEKVDLAAHVPGPEATAEEHQLCTECGYVLAVSEEHQHEYSAEWSYDDKSHWHECSCTGKSDLEVHNWQVTEKGDPVIVAECTVCGALKEENVTDIPDESTAPPQTDPTEPTQTPQTQEEGGVDAAVIVLSILLVLSLAGNGVLAWMLFGKKKKPAPKQK